MTPTLILASSSPRRRELLASLGVDFTIVKPQIDETRRDGEEVIAYVQRLSREKADAVAAQVTSPAAILAADTIVILAADTIGIATGGDLLEKPVDAADARHMLQRLRGRPHAVVTAITLLKLDDEPQRVTETVTTTVTMRQYSDAEIEAYIDSGDPFDKAGSYAIQNAAFHPVERISGSYTNVVGLPLEAVQRALDAIGWPYTPPPAGQIKPPATVQVVPRSEVWIKRNDE
jgi:septum formation protein